MEASFELDLSLLPLVHREIRFLLASWILRPVIRECSTCIGGVGCFGASCWHSSRCSVGCCPVAGCDVACLDLPGVDMTKVCSFQLNHSLMAALVANMHC